MRTILLVVVLVGLGMLGSAQTPVPHIKRTNPPDLSRPTGYTHVVETSGAVRTIYVAGQIAFDRSGAVVGAGDMKAQAEQVFQNLEIALAAAGAKFSDVVKMNTYVTDMSKVQVVREVRAKYLGTTAPASTLVQVPALARPELMIEIEVIAVVPDPPGLRRLGD